MPIPELGITWYSGQHGVVIYLGEFATREGVMDEDDVVYNVREEVTGETWEHGPATLLRRDIELRGALAVPGAQPYNVVVHEFAYKLDIPNNESDDIPVFSSRLHTNVDHEQWADDLYAEYDVFANRCEQTLRRRRGDNPTLSVLDPYGAQHPVEFLMAISEVFFVEPVTLFGVLPSLYTLLQVFYLQDPARRVLGFEQRQEGSLP